jgi:hypothetical protein
MSAMVIARFVLSFAEVATDVAGGCCAVLRAPCARTFI